MAEQEDKDRLRAACTALDAPYDESLKLFPCFNTDNETAAYAAPLLCKIERIADFTSDFPVFFASHLSAHFQTTKVARTVTVLQIIEACRGVLNPDQVRSIKILDSCKESIADVGKLNQILRTIKSDYADKVESTDSSTWVFLWVLTSYVWVAYPLRIIADTQSYAFMDDRTTIAAACLALMSTTFDLKNERSENRQAVSDHLLRSMLFDFSYRSDAESILKEICNIFNISSIDTLRSAMKEVLYTLHDDILPALNEKDGPRSEFLFGRVAYRNPTGYKLTRNRMNFKDLRQSYFEAHRKLLMSSLPSLAGNDKRSVSKHVTKLLMDPFRICEDNLIGARIDPKNLLFFPVFSPGVGSENHFFLWKKFRREAIYNLVDVAELGKHSTTEVTSKTPNLASDISGWLFELLPDSLKSDQEVSQIYIDPSHAFEIAIRLLPIKLQLVMNKMTTFAWMMFAEEKDGHGLPLDTFPQPARSATTGRSTNIMFFNVSGKFILPDNSRPTRSRVICEAVGLFNISLESIFRHESMRLGTSENFTMLADEDFHKALYAISVALILKAHSCTSITFSYILKSLEVSTDKFMMVSESFVTVMSNKLPFFAEEYLVKGESLVMNSLLWNRRGNFINLVRKENLEGTLKKGRAGEKAASKATSSAKANQEILPPSSFLVEFTLRKFLFFVGKKLDKLCKQLFIDEISWVVYDLFQVCFSEFIDLFVDRHVDQIVMCAVYASCKAMAISPPVTFFSIIEVYKGMNFGENCESVIHKVHVEEGDSINIIDFYNNVFLPKLKPQLYIIAQNHLVKRIKVCKYGKRVYSETRFSNFSCTNINFTFTPESVKKSKVHCKSKSRGIYTFGEYSKDNVNGINTVAKKCGILFYK